MNLDLLRALISQMADEPMRLTEEGRSELLALCDKADSSLTIARIVSMLEIALERVKCGVSPLEGMTEGTVGFAVGQIAKDISEGKFARHDVKIEQILSGDGWCICSGETVYLSHDGKWNSARAAYWPTREAAAKFLASTKAQGDRQ